METWKEIRKENLELCRVINKAWGHKVAFVVAQDETEFPEIKSTLSDGLSILYGRDWVPPFKTLKQLRAEGQ